MRIILGSQSPRRLEILRGVVSREHTIEVMPADIDEKAIRNPNPSALTMAIARAKGEALLPRLTGDVIIVTADTVARCNGEVREKPVDADELRAFVTDYSEYPVMAITSVWVHRTGTRWTGSVTDAASVRFRPFDDGRLDRIVADAAFYGSAGGFLIEHPLMRDHLIRVDRDPDTVQGLPGRLVKLLVADALSS